MKNTIKPLLFSFFIIFFSRIFSQTNEWTWIKGGANSYQYGVYGEKGVVTETNKPGGRIESVSWVDALGNLWLFGGLGFGSLNNDGSLSDLWKYNTTSKRWVWVDGDSTTESRDTHPSKLNKPGARASCATWTDIAGNLWLFGGLRYLKDSNVYFNDLWRYNIDRKQWTWVGGDTSKINSHGVYGIQGQASKQNIPGARNYAVTWTDASGNLWLFGGRGFAANGDKGDLNDLWKYNIANKRWTWVKGDSIINQKGVYGTQGMASSTYKPGARGRCTEWTDSEGNFWLFGGSFETIEGNFRSFNDLWKYNITHNRWTWVKGDSTLNNVGIYGTQGIAAKENNPGSRDYARGWADASGNFWLFGGRGFPKYAIGGSLNDLWKYNIQSNRWTWVKGDYTTNNRGVYGEQNVPSPDNTPGSRVGSVSWQPSMNKFWLFGGLGYARASKGYLNDLWNFTVDDGNPALTTELNENINAATSRIKLNAVLQPNPTASSFVLHVQPVNNEAISITIYNTLGSIVQQLKVQSHQQISFGEKFASGSYFIEIKQGNLRTTLTAIKR